MVSATTTADLDMRDRVVLRVDSKTTALNPYVPGNKVIVDLNNIISQVEGVLVALRELRELRKLAESVTWLRRTEVVGPDGNLPIATHYPRLNRAIWNLANIVGDGDPT